MGRKETTELVKPGSKSTRRENYSDVQLGQWYSVLHKLEEKADELESDEEDLDGKEANDQKTWLGCVVHIGSNYIKIQGYQHAHTLGFSQRIHIDQFHKYCTFVANPDEILAQETQVAQKRLDRLMDEVHQLTARLGVAPKGSLAEAPPDTQALATSLGDQNYGTYKQDLIKAQDKTLPELFDQIRRTNEDLAGLMSAKLLPLEAQIESMKGATDQIKDRIFNVELYAGLIEQVEHILKGEPAPNDTSIHLMQRRCYMDEECLAQYRTGGMDYKNIEDFDAWLCEDENLGRLMPFPRCVVAFRVRRERKVREAFRISDFIRIMEEAEADKQTFIYMRNGDNVYRLNTGVQFNEKLFPDMEKSHLEGKLYAEMWGHGVREIITEAHYLQLKADYKKELAEFKARKRAAKKGEYVGLPPRNETSDYEEFTPANLNYDDIKEYIEQQLKEHNRVVLILQGLLDRSPVFHPHPPWQLWTAEGFAGALRPVYDDSRALSPGDKPDFEKYREACNKTIKRGSITVGQDDYWSLREGTKESERISRTTYGYRSNWRPERHRPYGNPGPGDVARVARMKGESAVFEWQRKRLNRSRYSWDRKPSHIKSTISVPRSKLFNVDAYKPGDFKRFFADPRTRAEYLQWAWLLLEAEEYHAGNRKVQEPGDLGDE